MLNFSRSRVRALLYLYNLRRRREDDRYRAEIAEHALGLALSSRRSDNFLVRNVMRNARGTVLARLKREAARAAHLRANDPDLDAALDAAMAKDATCTAAQPPSIERDLIMRNAFDMLLREVKRQLGEEGATVARRFIDPIEDVARDIGCSVDRVKALRSDVRAIAANLEAYIRP